MSRDPAGAPPRLALALQGGGAHGAYGWGVVERLLDERIEIVAVSGASAGAMNGAALVTGLAEGGPDGAKAALERLWQAVAKASPLSAVDRALGATAASNPFVEAWISRSLEIAKMASRYFAPVTPGIRDMSALRRAVTSSLDLDRLGRPGAIPFHVSATRVASGAARMFTGAEVTLDALMASACLPDLFAAVEIDGEALWDGGFSANPALKPLIFDGVGATDLLIVQITPFAGEEPGLSLGDRMRRIADIGFNACLLRDVEGLIEVQDIARSRGIRDGRLGAVAAINLHLMEPPAALAARGGASKVDTRWSVLQELRAMGRASAEAWLERHRATLGRDSSLRALPEAVS